MHFLDRQVPVVGRVAERYEGVVVDDEKALVVDDHPGIPSRDLTTVDGASQRGRTRGAEGIDLHIDPGVHVRDGRMHDVVLLAAEPRVDPGLGAGQMAVVDREAVDPLEENTGFRAVADPRDAHIREVRPHDLSADNPIPEVCVGVRGDDHVLDQGHHGLDGVRRGHPADLDGRSRIRCARLDLQVLDPYPELVEKSVVVIHVEEQRSLRAGGINDRRIGSTAFGAADSYPLALPGAGG